MAKKEKISCRVCGKLFEPCAYCQSHTDVFRWRNFACSRECATKYINETIAYREALKNKDVSDKNQKIAHGPVVENGIESVIAATTTTRKRSAKKNLTTVVENEIENNKTE